MNIRKIIAHVGIYLMVQISLLSCVQRNDPDEDTFKLPDVPLIFALDSNYLNPDSTDVVTRLDSAGPRLSIKIHTLTKADYDSLHVDTMRFKHKNYYSDWDGQKRGYYWLIQGLTFSPATNRDKDGRETEVYDRIDENFMLQPVKQPAKGEQYPTVNYDVMDEYWSSLRADAVGVTSVKENELIVMAHPIRKKLRGPDYHYKLLSSKDSVAVPAYYDKVDSGKLICLQVQIKELKK
ncbi:hypothetical protein LT679_00950 [Mucilaginibacter roseus]|uniref:Uncharacterized protein n=1 Tax=Mucilaginibacter roseus TaxID=1528868 RepID=A0ABS8TW90_9SPHI|nr:hypothetical protein [Mucilaginibacter roseus]MCD8739153.1 hypothetical protein [Mucilaginibacter roseus]